MHETMVMDVFQSEKYLSFILYALLQNLYSTSSLGKSKQFSFQRLASTRSGGHAHSNFFCFFCKQILPPPCVERLLVGRHLCRR